MRFLAVGLILLTLCAFTVAQQKNTARSGDPSSAKTAAGTAAKSYTLTIRVEDVNDKPGNIGVLVFSPSDLRGWPEDRTLALKDIVVPAHPGTVTVTVPDLPAGEYGVALIHDVNQNHKIDKNFLGVPKEQWGMSNNPHATIKAPPFSKAKFTLDSDKEIQITLQ